MQDDLKNCPKISIITVSYNSAKTIEQTILSVINQSYKNIEYIIIDGGSTDGTVDIIKKYADKIAYWVSEPDEGIYHAMNKGIDIASGEYIYFLGSDDWLYDKKIISFIADKLIAEPLTDVLAGNVFSVDEDYKIQLPSSTVFGMDEINMGYRVPHQGCLVRTGIMKENKFDLRYRIVADYDLFLKMFFSGKYRYKLIEDFIAFYSAAGTSSTNVETLIMEDCLVMEKYNIAQNFIEKRKQVLRDFKGCRLNKLKGMIKRLTIFLGIYGKIQLKRGWKTHRCDWEKCRVCSK